MPFNKRRIKPAANKNQAKVLRRESAGGPTGALLETLNPRLEKLSIRFQFFDPNGNFLQENTVSAGPNESVDLLVDCVGPCGNGKIDLEGKLKDVLQKELRVSEGRSKCANVVHAFSNEVCGYELRCHFEISYKAA